jgi:transcriptional regulator with XRE-family HTH domain
LIFLRTSVKYENIFIANRIFADNGEVVILLGAKRARIGAGFTLKSAAEELGVSVVTLWRWEAGKQTPSIEKIGELAGLYGVTVRRLIKPPRPTRFEMRKSESLGSGNEHLCAIEGETQDDTGQG